MAKTRQIQIRVTHAEKSFIESRARAAGLDISKWLLGRAIPQAATKFHDIVLRLGRSQDPAFELAELNDFLSNLSRTELEEALSEPKVALEQWLLCYIAAMIELLCESRGMAAPEWTKKVGALQQPYFGSELHSLRLYLLANSPAPFRSRNIFIDSSIGARV